MGQYYKVAFGDNQGSLVSVFDLSIEGSPYEDDNWIGFKLMELSYWDNNFVNSVSTIIFNNPARIVWYIDYEDDEDLEYLMNQSSAKEIFQYNQVWEKGDLDLNMSKIF